MSINLGPVSREPSFDCRFIRLVEETKAVGLLEELADQSKRERHAGETGCLNA